MAEEDEAERAWGEVLRKRPRSASGTLDARKAREAAQSGPTLDGRRLRHTGRTASLFVKVRPEFKKLLDSYVSKKSSSQAAVIEWAVERCIAEDGEGEA